MVDCSECSDRDGSLFSALESIVWYDGHYIWLKELRDDLFQRRGELIYPMPKDIEWHTEIHTIWMLLVGMFCDWGTSIRGGWIENIYECIEFIEKLCEEMWNEESDPAEGR
jgi:hypothetical protein